MREIVLDIETTGLSFNKGDKIIEIGCVELINYIPSGKIYHQYINPNRDIPLASQRIHGITNNKVAKEPYFQDIADDLLNFIASSSIIIHNANFDFPFINHELVLSNKNVMQNNVIDTLCIARKKFPGSPASLNALCKRFNISISDRGFHGALLDSKLLAKVYLELIGGVQKGISFTETIDNFEKDTKSTKNIKHNNLTRKKRTFPLHDEEIIKHNNYIKDILKAPIWN